MTLPEWTKSVMDELRAAGFEVSEYQGFPLVQTPADFQEGVRLLKFHTSLAADRTIYSEGMLYAPAGAARQGRMKDADSSATPGTRPS